MDRRNFIRLGIAGAAGSIIAPKIVLAASPKISTPGAGGVFYTKDAPGRWSKKVGGHLPKIAVAKKGKDAAIEILTPHSMKNFEHYIVKHMLLDKDFKFLDETMFKPGKDKTAKSSYTLKGYSGPLYALSVCNKHDTWMEIVEV